MGTPMRCIGWSAVILLVASACGSPGTTLETLGVIFEPIDDRSYRVSRAGLPFSEATALNTTIDVGGQSFDPIRDGIPGIRDSVHFTVTDEDGLYIVQLQLQALPELQAQIAEAGGRIYTPLHHQALVVRMDGSARERIAAMPFVRWIGVYQSDYKHDPQRRAQNNSSAQRYILLLFEIEPAVQESLGAFVRAIGGEIAPPLPGSLVHARLTLGQLDQVLMRPDVFWAEPWAPAGDDMDLVREVTGANYIADLPQGYRGQGVRGEVMDRGLQLTHPEYIDAPNVIIRTGNNPDNNFNHGTTTFGVVFAQGKNPKAMGMLPEAEAAIFVSRYAITGSSPRDWPAQTRYNHTQELVDPLGDYRGLFQSNSWGSELSLSYTAHSADMDRIALDMDIPIINSQSNEGDQTGRERYSRPEAWAKNAVAVGGIIGRNTADWNDDCWCNEASIGPASDGRIRPELSHYFDATFAPTNGGTYRDHNGTSFSTPSVAGQFGLLMQMWADGIFSGGPGQGRDVFDSRPHATTARALMINMARQYDFTLTDPNQPSRYHPRHRIFQGWGLPSVRNVYDTAQAHDWQLPVLIDESAPLEPTERHRYEIESAGNTPLKATLVYADPPGNPSAQGRHVINDLNLRLTGPQGQEYFGNVGLFEGPWSRPGGASNPALPALPSQPETLNDSVDPVIDTIENVYVQFPAAGTWTVEVVGTEIIADAHAKTPQIDVAYALVVTGAGPTTAPDPAPPTQPTPAPPNAPIPGPNPGPQPAPPPGDTPSPSPDDSTRFRGPFSRAVGGCTATPSSAWGALLILLLWGWQLHPTRHSRRPKRAPSTSGRP